MREFADPAHTRRDLETLEHMRASLRAHPEPGVWRVGLEEHWLVAPDPPLLAARTAARAVGFFGQARADVDHEPIIRLEHALTDRAAELTGLLGYHDVRLASGQWGNLVVFAEDGGGPLRVRDHPTHLDALALAPAHYHSVRLHRLRLPDGALGEAPIELVETLLLDFSESPPWREVRA